MPEGAPLVKVAATQGYGARVILHGATFEDAYVHARALGEGAGSAGLAALLHPGLLNLVGKNVVLLL